MQIGLAQVIALLVVRLCCTFNMYIKGGHMRTYTTSQARQNIAEVMEAATAGEPVEITRRDGSAAVLISRDDFNAWQEAKLDAEFAEIMGRHGRTIKALADR
jgi:antitoxin Phd